jgi:pyruvate dehydrogenase E1 component
MACDEYNRLHPLTETESWVSQQLRDTDGIVVSATDHMRL